MTREEAIDVLKKTLAYESDFAEAKRMAIEALQDRPSGKWRVKYGAHSDVLIKECYCDQCGKRGGLATMLFDDKPLPNFCGNCGADMRAKSDDERGE